MKWLETIWSVLCPAPAWHKWRGGSCWTTDQMSLPFGRLDRISRYLDIPFTATSLFSLPSGLSEHGCAHLSRLGSLPLPKRHCPSERWYCDIVTLVVFFGRFIGLEGFFPSWQMRYVESITKTPLRPTKQTQPTVHALHRAHSKLYKCTAHH